MPTENRSSNTEMVSVPRDKLQAWQERFSKAQIFRESSEVQALLAQTAEQHQGEPVALPERKGTHLRYDTLMPTFSKGWNACLDEIAKLGPLYTNADPNVRWKAVADEQMLVIAGLRQHKTDYMEAAEETRKALRSQLAERDALIREAIPMLLDDATGNPDVPLEKLRRLLSASAEPSAPAERDERADFAKWTHEVIGTHEFEGVHHKVQRRDSMSKDDESMAWEGWQARAALERKP
ncbi:hypothetical protein [Pseudomonas mosselii]|uniref:hypothetical protein n=1 Tax=Pseudomonas mosselii TaxID=78327 RepID=UPI0012FD2B42|nr:hypothetical protein [Pseudomonas mosselii]